MKKLTKSKYTIILGLLLFLCGCNNDDNLNLDPIIGTWKQISIMQNGKEYHQQDDCFDDSNISFLADGSVIEILYYKENGNCKARTNDYNWRNINNSKYKIGDVDLELEFFNNNMNYKYNLEVIDFDGNPTTATITYKRIN